MREKENIWIAEQPGMYFRLVFIDVKASGINLDRSKHCVISRQDRV